MIPALTGLLFLVGCMSFDYVGQSFAPKGESAPVNIIYGRNRIPAEKYRIIGRGILKSPGTMDHYDSEVRLRNEARARGADAVCVISTVTRSRSGFSDQEQGAFAPPAAGRKDPQRSRNTPWDPKSSGTTLTQNSQNPRVTVEKKVIFLKKTSDFNAEMKDRSSFL